MRWIGLNDGYVSADGLFLVAPVTVQTTRGTRQKWALFGLVRQTEGPWRWTDEPIYGPLDTKRACQEWAASSRYVPPVVDGDGSRTPTPVSGDDKPRGWEHCSDCGVKYVRKPGHIFGDYCGDVCFAIVAEKVDEIREKLRKRGKTRIAPEPETFALEHP